MKFRFDCGFISRALIALLFVIAGMMKLGLGQPGTMSDAFKATASTLPQAMPFLANWFPNANSLTSVTGVMLALVIIIEIPVALLYAYGYKYQKAGWALVAFVTVVTIFYHNPWLGGQFNPGNLVQALKNIAIIGGILSTLGCYCGKKCKI